MQPNPLSPSHGKFAAVFAKRTFTPLEEIPPALTSHMKSMRRHIRHRDHGRPLPQRHFAGLSVLEQMEHATSGLMWVRERRANGTLMRSSLWLAPSEAIFNATPHGAAAPSDAELLAIGWRQHAPWPVHENKSECPPVEWD